MTPLSKEEIAGIKGLRLEAFVDIPVMHQKDIEYVFFEVMPKLIAIAEDHAMLSQKPEVVQPEMGLESKQVQAFHKVAQTEKQLLAEMERCFQLARSVNEQKARILAKIEEPIIEPAPIIEPEIVVPVVKQAWYVRLFRNLTGKL